MLKYCMEYQVSVIVNSDAHTDTLVGFHKYAQEIFDAPSFLKLLAVTEAPVN